VERSLRMSNSCPGKERGTKKKKSRVWPSARRLVRNKAADLDAFMKIKKIPIERVTVIHHREGSAFPIKLLSTTVSNRKKRKQGE